ncbi:alpha/beta hydrolase family protein [Persicitalea sp.]|uniref:alpha/beta hydrolase family protein n=1 Tax=Persicitalea sp. TaxID=3100273 RepID=UPI0035947FC2
MNIKKVFLAFIFLTAVNMAIAQVPGRWEGTAEVNGKPLLVAFNVSDAGAGSFSTTMDVPAQGAKALPCDETKVEGDSIFISIKMIGGRYAGRFDATRSATTGALQQGKKLNTPLDLKRTGDAVALDRPQTPKPPFPYKSEEVEYDSPDKTVHLGATLTTPKGEGPFPVALLITGSSLQDRDESIMGHKPFLVIADYLTRRGIAVLRVDDRNMGKSTGPAKATSADYAQDAMMSLDFLRKRKGIDPKRIGIIGHSEGGMIAQIVNTARPKDLAFIVSLAGPGEPILDLMAQQNTANLKSMKVHDSVAEGYGAMMRSMMEAASSEKDSAALDLKITEALSTWRSSVMPGVFTTLTGITDEATERQFVGTIMKTLRDPWMNYFIGYDPTQNLSRIKCPVLAINGAKDIQVMAKSNLAGWETVKKNGNKDVTTKAMPGLNHLFQHCDKCTVAEYEVLTETFSPEVLKIMGDWLTEKVLR